MHLVHQINFTEERIGEFKIDQDKVFTWNYRKIKNRKENGREASEAKAKS